jgi:hypothetical protein
LNALLGGGKLAQLTALDLRWNNRLSSEALAALAFTPALTHLDLTDCAAIDDTGLVFLAQHCRQLKTLCLSDLKRITADGLIPVLQNNAYALPITTHTTSSYAHPISRTTLSELFVDYCSQLDADALFNNLPPRLQRLSCQHIVKHDRSLKVLAFACPKLTHLSIKGGGITDFGFKMLASNPPSMLVHLVSTSCLRPQTASAHTSCIQRMEEGYMISDVGLSYIAAGAPKLRCV